VKYKIVHEVLIGTNIRLTLCIGVGDISINRSRELPYVISCFADDYGLRIPLPLRSYIKTRRFPRQPLGTPDSHWELQFLNPVKKVQSLKKTTSVIRLATGLILKKYFLVHYFWVSFVHGLIFHVHLFFNVTAYILLI